MVKPITILNTYIALSSKIKTTLLISCGFESVEKNEFDGREETNILFVLRKKKLKIKKKV